MKIKVRKRRTKAEMEADRQLKAEEVGVLFQEQGGFATQDLMLNKEAPIQGAGGGIAPPNSYVASPVGLKPIIAGGGGGVPPMSPGGEAVLKRRDAAKQRVAKAERDYDAARAKAHEKRMDAIQGKRGAADDDFGISLSAPMATQSPIVRASSAGSSPRTMLGDLPPQRPSLTMSVPGGAMAKLARASRGRSPSSARYLDAPRVAPQNTGALSLDEVVGGFPSGEGSNL